jgi:hypothetical protein
MKINGVNSSWWAHVICFGFLFLLEKNGIIYKININACQKYIVIFEQITKGSNSVDNETPTKFDLFKM